MSDRRAFFNPDDVAGRLADLKAEGAQEDFSVDTRDFLPRGTGIVVDIGAIREAYEKAVADDVERRFLGDLDNWDPIGILPTWKIIPPDVL